MYLNLKFLVTVAKDIHNNCFHADFTLKPILHSEPVSTDGVFPFPVLLSCDEGVLESGFGHVTLEHMGVIFFQKTTPSISVDNL